MQLFSFHGISNLTVIRILRIDLFRGNIFPTFSFIFRNDHVSRYIAVRRWQVNNLHTIPTFINCTISLFLRLSILSVIKGVAERFLSGFLITFGRVHFFTIIAKPFHSQCVDEDGSRWCSHYDRDNCHGQCDVSKLEVLSSNLFAHVFKCTCIV